MIKSVIIIVLIIAGYSFGSYPKFLSLKDTESILLETRNYECMRKIGSNRSKCLNIETYIDNQTEIRMLENAFNTMWCPFLPLSLEGAPYYKLTFKSNSYENFNFYVKGNEISLGCFLPSDAKNLLNEITNRRNLTSK